MKILQYFTERKVVFTSLVIGQIVALYLYLPYKSTNLTLRRQIKAQNNVGFLKVHKAGSSTLLNIFMRYGWQANLTIALPQKSNIIHNDFNNLVPLRFGTRYNMLVNHVKRFERWKFEQVLYWDTNYVAVVRNPLDLTISAFNYYLQFSNSSIYSKIPGENKLREYLNNRGKYDPIPNWNSYTNNRMALDFGIPVKQMRNVTFIEGYIKQLESEIDLVLILEFFDESLILLRRLLGWKINDMLYLALNSIKKIGKLNFTEAELNYHRKFSLADNMLYEHFMERFKEKVEAAGDNFQSEVNIFKTIKNKVTQHCKYMEYKPLADKTLMIEKTALSEPIVIGPLDCHMMLLSEYKFINMYRNRYAA